MEKRVMQDDANAVPSSNANGVPQSKKATQPGFTFVTPPVKKQLGKVPDRTLAVNNKK